LALQLGGSDPQALAACARIGADLGFDEINLNIGCASDRVREGRFGACLMAEPALVGDCVAAMKAAASVPVTVKCRIGVDEQDTEAALETFARAVEQAGVDALIVHARKAWLKGLSPKENREGPPLDYARVYRLKGAHPRLTVVLNGGIASIEAARAHLARVRGGRRTFGGGPRSCRKQRLQQRIGEGRLAPPVGVCAEDSRKRGSHGYPCSSSRSPRTSQLCSRLRKLMPRRLTLSWPGCATSASIERSTSPPMATRSSVTGAARARPVGVSIFAV